MRSSKLAILLFLLGAFVLAACSPGGGNTGALSNAKPTRLQIKVFEVTQPTPITLLIEDAATVQNVYKSALVLPPASSNQTCPAIAGPRYELTFLERGKVVVTAIADRGGCTSVTIGADDVRQPNEAFWQLLNRVIAQAAPTVRPDKAEVVSYTGLQQPPTLSTIASADQARQLYNTIRALPALADNGDCPELFVAGYRLVFFEEAKSYQAELDLSGCISGPSGLLERHQANEAFWHLLSQMLAIAPTAKARPDILSLNTQASFNDPSTTAPSSVIKNQDLIQLLYQAIYAMPHQPGNQTCPAITGTVYRLSFAQDGAELLTAIANKGGCGTVTYEGYVRRANQAFWDLLRQAQTT